MGFSCSTYSHPRFQSRCPCLTPRQQERNGNVRLSCCLSFDFFVPQTDWTDRRRRKRTGVRMTQSYRKAVMSVNMSHNRGLFTDTLLYQKETHRWHLSALACMASQQCLFLMGIRNTRRGCFNLSASSLEKTRACQINNRAEVLTEFQFENQCYYLFNTD